MEGLVCDACQATLLLDSSVRYVVKIRGHAAYDPLELTSADLERDHEADLRAVLDQLANMDPQAAEDQVHKEFDIDLCPACWQRYIRDPLRGLCQ